MNVPTDYIEGYEKARAIDAELADRYVAHTTVGDPEADAVMEEIAALGREEGNRFVHAGMEQDEDELREAPQLVRDFFKGLDTPPDWVDPAAFIPGIRMFHRNSRLVLGGMVGGTLIEGFSTNIAKSFFISGRLRDQGVRRLKQNNRHMVEIFMPHGLERDGDGWKLSVRIRLIHAQVRRLLAASDEWDAEAWGTPISAAHVGFAITAFSARLLKHLKSLGAVYNDEERASFMQVWRYTGFLMGIPETMLYRDEKEALRIFDIGVVSEPVPGIESIAMANSLIAAAPLVAGITESDARRSLAKYVGSVSRALIGNTLADQLRYPKYNTFGVLPWFRLQTKYSGIMAKLRSNYRQDNAFANFTGLLTASMFEEAGISYRLPDHVYAEESSQW